MANSSFFKNTGTSTQIQGSANASAAAALASEQAALVSKNAAQTSETNAAASAAAALVSKNAAASSAASANSDATAAAASAVTSQTAATSSSANAALTSADAVQTAADRVQTGLDVVAAAGSATAAAASQVSAAASAASAAAVFNDFEDRYYGPHASDSAAQTHVTGLGLTVDQGDLYFNSTANEMRVYDGGSWVAASSAGGASLLNYNFTATASQTAFTGADDNSRTLSYTVGNLIVTRNGVVLEDGTDYTATSGTSIVLAAAAAAGDEINVVAFKSFTTADMVSATNGGTFQSNVTVNGTMTATAFSGDGSALTNLPAAGISDVVQDTTPQLGGNLDTNGNNVNFGDNNSAIFGAGNDLQIYHSGLHSYVDDTGTGDLRLRGNAGVYLGKYTGESMVDAIADGAVTLYHNNAAKLATSSFGAQVTGSLAVDTITNASSSTDVTIDTNFDIILDGANVGIGTSSPAQRLHVVGGAVQFQNTQSTYLQINTGDTHLYTAGSHPLRFGTNGIERLNIQSDGNVNVGGANIPASSGAAGRYFDINNLGTDAASFAIQRLITYNVAGTGTTSADIYKRKNGQFTIANNETDTAAYMNFQVGTQSHIHISNTGGGSVGVGTQAPVSESKLTVANGSLSITGSDQNFGGGGVRGMLDLAGGYLRMGAVNGGGSASGVKLLAPAGGEALVVDSSGRVTMPYQPMVSASRTTNFGTLGGGTNLIPYNSATVNVGNHYNASTGLFTCPVSGKYRVTAYGMNAGASGNGVFYYNALIVEVAGSTQQSTPYNYGDGYVHLSGSWIVSASANDSIGIRTSSCLGGYGGMTIELIG
jgi:hypothetical protein